MEATYNSNAIGEFFFYFVKFSNFYVALFLFCNVLKFLHYFLKMESVIWKKTTILLKCAYHQRIKNFRIESPGN